MNLAAPFHENLSSLQELEDSCILQLFQMVGESIEHRHASISTNADLSAYYSAIHVFVLECIRLQYSVSTFQTYLDALHLSPAIIETLGNWYTTFQPGYQALLEHSGIHFNRFQNIHWRLDYILQSQEHGILQQPIYLIQLDVQTPAGSRDTIEFTCTVAQLQDFLTKVQDAQQQLQQLKDG